MPKSLAPIPAGVAITDGEGRLTEFFLLRWEELRLGFQLTPTVAHVVSPSPDPTAAIVTTSAFTTLTSGLYRVSYYLRKTVADGVSSSLTFTWGWTESGVPLTDADPALTTDTTGAVKSGSRVLRADASGSLTFAIGYASNTPNRMAYLYNVAVELLTP